MKTLSIKSKVVILISLALLVSAIAVAPAYASTLIVTNTDDSGAGSLRDVLAGAASRDTIIFDPSLSGATIHLTSTLTLTQDVTIDGSTLAVPISISGDSDNDGDSNLRVLVVNSGVTAILDNLVITKGRVVSDVGGGIVNHGTLTVNNSILLDNFSADGGGAIFNYNNLTVTNSIFSSNSTPGGGAAILNISTLMVSGSTFSNNVETGANGGAIGTNGAMTVIGSTFARNSTTAQGGGIFVIGGTAAVKNSTFSDNSADYGGGISTLAGTSTTVVNSTFSGNTGSTLGGGIYNASTVTVTNSTFSGNVSNAGDGILNTGTLNYANTIIANSSTSDCSNLGGTIGTNTNNLVEDGSCSAALSGDPNLDSLGDNSGSTQTLGLLPGSLAIDAGDDTICAAAPVSNVDQRGFTRPFGTSCDIGAFEYITTYFVTKAADTNDGVCDSDCSLREAITATNANADADTIRFDGNYTITLGSSLPSIPDDLTIDGKGHTVVIDGNNAYRIFEPFDNLHLKNMTIQNGNGTDGGAILSHDATTIANVTFSNNTASNSGGAIKNAGTILIISNSTFTSNTADIGGAIIAQSGMTTIINSTFSGNTATSNGAGIYNDTGSILHYSNTIIANSTSGSDCTNAGTLGANVNNLVKDGSCFASLSGDPNLDALADNGGSTQTFALLTGSTAINAGNDAICAASPIYGIDQRGVTRPNSSHCDIGSYEYEDTTAPMVTAFTAASSSTSLNIPIMAFTTLDDVSVSGYLITTSSTPPSASDSGWTGSAPTTYTVGSSGIYTLYPWAKDAAGNVSAVYGSPVNVTVTTTLTFKSTALHDGWILESSETSGNGGTMNATATVLYLGDNAQKKQYRSILSFTTSSLPDNAVITKVTLKLKRQGITGGGNPVSMFQGFMADVKKGMFGTAPLALADFKVNANKTVGPQSPALTSGWYSLNLTPAKAYVNKLATNSGLTQIRLRFKLDDNNNATANFLKLYSGNSGAANRPQLIVEYYVP